MSTDEPSNVEKVWDKDFPLRTVALRVNVRAAKFWSDEKVRSKVQEALANHGWFVDSSFDVLTDILAGPIVDEHRVYKIIRFYQDENVTPEVIKTGLTLMEAQAHCKDETTHGEGWFDGYDEEA